MFASVDRLYMATVKLAGQFNPPTYADTRINVYAYLIRAGSNVVLVDTGVGIGSDRIDDKFQPQRTPVVEELARLDVELTDVNFIVNSHLHFDHCGNNGLFPNAEVFIQEDELTIARALKTRYTVPWWFDFDGARINPVRGDVEIIAGIRLLSTPGHTPGHQSLLVESGAARVVVAAQAAFTADEYLRGGDPGDQAHEGLECRYVESIARLKSIGANGIYFSHDSTTATVQSVKDR